MGRFQPAALNSWLQKSRDRKPRASPKRFRSISFKPDNGRSVCVNRFKTTSRIKRYLSRTMFAHPHRRSAPFMHYCLQTALTNAHLSLKVTFPASTSRLLRANFIVLLQLAKSNEDPKSV